LEHFTIFGQPIAVNQSRGEQNMLENITKITIENPVDLIISQIRELISSESVKPGEKLPPERKLAKHFGVSRGQVREAINKLQFYGILKVLPQSGTIVSGTGIAAMEGIITDVLKIEKADFKSLIDTRVLLEKEAVRLAALHRTEENLLQMDEALNLYEKKLEGGETAIEEDLNFHLVLAEAGKNSVLKSLMVIIAPDIIKSFIKLNVCEVTNKKTIKEHREILDRIINQDPEGAMKSMENHLSDIIDFSKS
jgi:GntR family transcriptional repressor for pyruvate dehydrogenase complex